MTGTFKRRDNQGGKIKPPPQGSGSILQEKPVFSLIHLQSNYDLDKCTQAEKASFADKLYRLSRMTWGEIRVAHRHGLGFETIARTSIKAGIPDVITPDVRIIAFRFHEKAPMVGFHQGGTVVFHVVWLDRGFTLYEHG
ncbi:MAG: hypothetical protein HQL90_14370 [Magnetococcales bacterium]|nr:hypothetical protein [Magnetococcales bacterium]